MSSIRWPVPVLLGLLVSLSADAEPLGLQVNIQPIRMCAADGSDCADPTGELFVAAGQKIWAQAGIFLNFLPWKTYADDVDAYDLYNNVDDTGVGILFNYGDTFLKQSYQLDVWFVHHLVSSPGTTLFGESILGGDQAIINWDTVWSDQRIDTIYHEIGHNLGLDHTPDNAQNNLMTAGTYRSVPASTADIYPDGSQLDQLTAAQILTADASGNLFSVPEPALAGAVAAALLVLSAKRRRMA